MTLTTDDHNLINDFISGDIQAYDALVRKYQDRIYSVCYRMMGNHHDANDCAQETFIKAYRSLKSFRFKSKFSTWLYRIAINTCKNKFSSAHFRFVKKLFHIDASMDSEEGGRPFEIHDDTLAPHTVLEKKEKSVVLMQAINSLSGEHKTMIVLRDIEGHSYDEIAEITGYSSGTVKSRLSRARKKLAHEIKGIAYEMF